MARTINDNATQGFNDANSGIYNEFTDEDGIIPVTINNSSYDFDLDTSTYLIDVRGREFAGFSIKLDDDVNYQTKATSVDYNDLSELTESDFNIDIDSDTVITFTTLAEIQFFDIDISNYHTASAVVLYYRNPTKTTELQGFLRALNRK